MKFRKIFTKRRKTTSIGTMPRIQFDDPASKPKKRFTLLTFQLKKIKLPSKFPSFKFLSFRKNKDVNLPIRKDKGSTSSNKKSGGSSLTIRQKLIGGFLSVSVLLLLSSGTAYYFLNQTEKSFDNILNKRNALLLNAKDMKAMASEETSNMLMYLATNDQNKLNTMQDQNSLLESMVTKTQPLADTKDDQEALKKLQGYNKLFKDKAVDMVNMMKGDPTEAMRYAKEQIVPLATFMVSTSNDIVGRQQAMMSSDSLAVSRTVASTKITLLIISLIAFALALVIGYFLARMIAKPLVVMADAANQIASGDLTREDLEVKSRDEVGNLAASFNLMANSLRNLIRQVGGSAEQVAASAEQLTASAGQTSLASEQITVTVQEVAEGTDHQVRSIEEAVQTVSEMSAGVQQIAANTHNVSAAAVQASDNAAKGGQSIKVAVQQMNSIQQTVNGIAEVIKQLGERSQQINQIVRVISDIASQTNLLALNAAIEAARAGEHGRGFAVVADEVRKLAEQSNRSAKEISELVNSIQHETTKAVESMASGTQEVAEGIEVVHTAGDAFEQIQQSINQLVGQIQEVSAASQQMSGSTEHVVQTMKTIAEVSETTAVGTQSVSAASEEQLASMSEITSSAGALSEMAEELQDLVKQFKI